MGAPFKSFRSTVTPSLPTAPVRDLRLLTDPNTGAPVGIQSQNGGGPDGVWTPVDVTADQIANPPAAMLADLNSTFRLSEAPYVRYYSDGFRLVESGVGSNVFDTIADLNAAHLPSIVTRVEVRGYRSPGDTAGSAFYNVVGSEPSHPFKQQDADGTWLEFGGVWHCVEMLGAYGDYTDDNLTPHDDWQAFQDYQDFGTYVVTQQGGRPGFTFNALNKRYLIGDEIDGTAWPVQTAGLKWRGQGQNETIFKPKPGFGRGKALFNYNVGDTSNRILYGPEFENCAIEGNADFLSGEFAMDDPVGVFAPFIQSGTTWTNFDIRSLGNKAVFSYEIDNLVWVKGAIYQSGAQYINRALGTCYWGGTSGTKNLSAFTNSSGTPYLGAFTGMAGKTVLLARGNPTGSDYIQVVTIDTPGVDGSTTTIVEDLTNTAQASDRWFMSYHYIKGTIDAGDLSTLVVSSAEEFSADDVVAEDGSGCRYIYIAGAGDGTDRDGHFTRITAIDGTNVTLEDAALRAVSDVYVLIAPAITVSPSVDALASGALTNGVHLIGVNMWHLLSSNVLLTNCANFHVESNDDEGRLTGTARKGGPDFGRSGFLLYMDQATSVNYSDAYFATDMNIVPGKGTIMCTGVSPRLTLINTRPPAPHPDGYSISWYPTGGKKAALILGGLPNGVLFDNYPIDVGGDYTRYQTVYWGGASPPVFNTDATIDVPAAGFLQVPSVGGPGPYTIADDQGQLVNQVVCNTLMLITAGDPADDMVAIAYMQTARDGGTASWLSVYTGANINLFVSASTSSTFDPAAEGADLKLNVAILADNNMAFGNRTGAPVSKVSMTPIAPPGG